MCDQTNSTCSQHADCPRSFVVIVLNYSRAVSHVDKKLPYKQELISSTEPSFGVDAQKSTRDANRFEQDSLIDILKVAENKMRIVKENSI